MNKNHIDKPGESEVIITTKNGFIKVVGYSMYELQCAMDLYPTWLRVRDNRGHGQSRVYLIRIDQILSIVTNETT